MLSAEEFAELRALQERAYGREGSLATDELARLQELEARRREAVALSDTSAPSAAQPEAAAEPTASIAEPAPATERIEDDESGSGLGSASARREPRHPRLRWLIAGVAAALAIGVGIGWSVWGQSHDAIALTDEQRGWQDDLAAEQDYDPGSLYAVREESGVIVWLATRDDGEKSCLLMSDGRQSETSCQPTKGAHADGMRAQLEVPAGDSYTDVTTANVLFSADGRPAVATEQYRNSFGAAPVYEPEEQKIADRLIDRGFQQSALWIVGYFDDRPVWSGAHVGAEDEQCLVYVAASGEIDEDCGTWEENLEDPLAFTIGPGDEDMRAAEIVYASTANGPQYLTITVRPVTDVAVDTETGDVIEFTVDDPTFDDLVIDDKTGELGDQ